MHSLTPARRVSALAALIVAAFTLMATSPARSLATLDDEVTVTLAPGESLDVLAEATRSAVRRSDGSAITVSVDGLGGPAADAGAAESVLSAELLESGSPPIELASTTSPVCVATNWHDGCERDACTRTLRLALNPEATSPVTVVVRATTEFVSDEKVFCAGPREYPDSAVLTVRRL